MKNILLPLLFSLLSTSVLSAQNMICTKSGRHIAAENVQLTDNNVVYYVTEKNKKVQRVINKTEVYRIIKPGTTDGVHVLESSLQNSGCLAFNFAVTYGSTNMYTIGDVVDASLLPASGLQINDRITHFFGFPLNNFSHSEIEEFLYGMAGDYLELTVNRDGREIQSRIQYYRYEEDDEGTNLVDISTPPITYIPPVSGNTTRSGNSSGSAEPLGVYLSFQAGPGAASFRNLKPFNMMYEFEIGHCNDNNFSNAFKFSILHHIPENNLKLYSFQYSFTQHFGMARRSGFFLGMDLGLTYVPGGDKFFWNPGLHTGVDIKAVHNLRIGLFGNFYVLPTYDFSNVAVGGGGGLRITGIL
ncbi:MAG: hypothetical protein IBJ09_06545 [Bacteroidia bacterium]|nr:hypothetical protein [Bacteroidia bacterium]